MASYWCAADSISAMFILLARANLQHLNKLLLIVSLRFSDDAYQFVNKIFLYPSSIQLTNNIAGIDPFHSCMVFIFILAVKHATSHPVVKINLCSEAFEYYLLIPLKHLSKRRIRPAEKI